MPNIKSAVKRVQLTKQRTLKNASQRSSLRTAIRRFEEALATDPASAKTSLGKAVRSLDKAVARGIIHKNAAARKKSRLSRKLNKVVG